MNYRKAINTAHVALIAPLLLYTGYTLQQGNKLPRAVPQLLTAAGIGVLVYHGYQAFQKLQAGAKLTTSYGLQVNAFHALLLAPFLAYTGRQLLRNQNVQPWQRTALMLFGGGALAYHASRLLRRRN